MNTVRLAFENALPVLAMALGVLTTAVVVAKALRQIRDARRNRLVGEIRPRVLAALAADSALPDLEGRRRAVAESIALSLLPKLRGADRDALAGILDDGLLAEAHRGLRSRSAARRQRSADLLGAAGRERSTRRLIGLLADRDKDVRMAACRALGRIGAACAVGPMVEALDDRRLPANTMTMAILRIGAQAGPGVIGALDSPTPSTRAIAAELAGSLGLTQACERLELMLGDPDVTVRRSVARALGRLGIPSSAGMLIDLLWNQLEAEAGEQDRQLAVALVIALGNIGHPGAVAVLSEARRREHSLAFPAMSALAGMGAREVPAHVVPIDRDRHRRGTDLVESESAA